MRCCTTRRCDCVFATSAHVSVSGDGSDKTPLTLTKLAGNFDARYVIYRNAAQRDTYLPITNNGDEAYLTAEKRLYTHSGSAWVRTAWFAPEGRTGVSLRRSVFDVLNNTAATIDWDDVQFDSDGFCPDVDFNGEPDTPFATITIPTGLGGLYAMTTKVLGHPGNTTIRIQQNGSTISMDDVAGVSSLASHAHTSGVYQLNAGDLINVVVFQNSGSTRTFQNGYFDFYRIGV